MDTVNLSPPAYGGPPAEYTLAGTGEDESPAAPDLAAAIAVPNPPAPPAVNALPTGDGGGSGPLAWTEGVIDLSAAGSTNIANAQTWLLGRKPISLGAGAGAYTQNLIIGDGAALPGALLRIPIGFPASANPTINVYDSSIEGTLLEGPLINPNPGAAASFLLTLGFDGADWHKENGQWIV